MAASLSRVEIERESRIAESAEASTCLHCQLPMQPGQDSSFCCRGCESVHALLASAGLNRYYDLGGGSGHPVLDSPVDHKWLEPIAERLSTQAGLVRVPLDVQGLHCSACVWLFEEMFRREPDGAGILVNSSIGTVELTVGPQFPLASYIESLESFGYRFGEANKAREAESASGQLVWRMGVCIAIAMNAMLFGFAVYAGLAEGRVYHLFQALSFALAIASVVVGGSLFFRSAWQAVRRGILHLDLPIAIGIALAFGSSTLAFFSRGGATSYFDTLDVFIALMLVGRFLQERVLAKNRSYILANEGAEGLYTRRFDGNSVSLVRCTTIRESDVLLVGHQDLVPVESELLGDEPAVFSLDWINGESAPRAFSPGERVPAGAFCQDPRAVKVRATTSFDASSIVTLLRTSSRRAHDVARATPWWKRLTAIYVVAVLATAVFGFAGWLYVTHDLPRTLDVTAALLIVTCPCAFGIATPLAYELAQAQLRRRGLFVRTPGFLDRAAEVTRIVFDKTGTLTTGVLKIANPDVFATLTAEEKSIAYDLAVRSSHPKSRAIATALEALSVHGGHATLDIREIAGKGLDAAPRNGAKGPHWRLGAPRWACGPNVPIPAADVVLTRDGVVIAAFCTGETLRADTRREVEALVSEGYDPCILSGDSPEATREMADACGLTRTQAFGARSPEGKAAWLRTLHEADGRKALFVGDGINDSLVADEAHCAGTPAIDRPFMAARCDFYFVSPGLGPVRAALHMARKLRRVVRTNLGIAIFYNFVTVTLALSGLMTPLWCAVLMPLSSLSTVLATTAQLKRNP
jgi:Cu2+-exporting ATPase